MAKRYMGKHEERRILEEYAVLIEVLGEDQKDAVCEKVGKDNRRTGATVAEIIGKNTEEQVKAARESVFWREVQKLIDETGDINWRVFKATAIRKYAKALRDGEELTATQRWAIDMALKHKGKREKGSGEEKPVKPGTPNDPAKAFRGDSK